ncbi:RpnC/YadD family protein [Caldanaerobius fijiensis]|nr:hypothetical protein [Caldanaerobius fijiensis]
MDYSRAICDKVVLVDEDDGKKKYHIEFQTLNDRAIVIRMIDYGFGIVIDGFDYNNFPKDSEITIEFPSQIVIFLKKGPSIPNELRLNIKMPYTGEKIEYKVPTFKTWEHGLEYYKREELYIMFPLKVIDISEYIEKIKSGKINEEEKKKRLEEAKKELIFLIEEIIEELNKKAIAAVSTYNNV